MSFQPNASAIDTLYLHQTINWAVLGCGNIANTFMAGIEHVPNANVIACAARNSQRAKEFADNYNIPMHFGSYESMLHERSVHAVYIASTHNVHFEHIMLCLQHGKHVLCEKPLTLNANQASEAYKLAAQNNLLLVEAMWTRFLPSIIALQKELANNTIGRVQCVQANFSINGEFPNTHRLNNPSLGGGALLDLGIYPISLADIVFGEAPVSINAHFIASPTGVDENSFYTLVYDSGAVAQLSAGFNMSGPTYANIMGDKGAIWIPFFLGAKSYSITLHGQTAQHHEYDFDESANFAFEIEHVTQSLLSIINSPKAIDNDVLASTVMPPSVTLRVMNIMDTIRQQWNLRYPSEK